MFISSWSSFIHWKKKKNKKKRKISLHIYSIQKQHRVLLRLSFSFISCFYEILLVELFFLLNRYDVTEDFFIIFTILWKKSYLNIIRLFAVFTFNLVRRIRELHNSCSDNWHKAGQVFVTNSVACRCYP